MLNNHFHKLLLIFLLICFSGLALAQQEFRQEVNHKINVELNVINKTLKGQIQTEYINNSPDTLLFLYYHLWPNAYKNLETPFAQQQLQIGSSDFYYSDDEYKGHITCENCKINGNNVKFIEIGEGIEDIKILQLPNPLLPSDTLVFSANFVVQIPKLTSRLGWSNKDFCISQWYPKPAVYDSYGWHPMSYLDVGEFYSEFGRFDVNIILPDNYLVAATGDLTNRQELKRLENYADLCKKISVRQDIISFGDSTKTKTLNFVANNVHDFAWFSSPDFIVDRKFHFMETQNRYVNCWAFYHKHNFELWSEATDYIAKTIHLMSQNVGDYPFNNCTAVDAPLGAGGGMEYPTITVVSADNKRSLENVIAHEVIHNWFYGMLASNERDNPWIDEGFTSFYECKYFDHYYPNEGTFTGLINKNIKIHGLEKLPERYARELAWKYLVSENLHQNPKLNSEEFSVFNYFILSYYKPVMALYSLEEYIGHDNFRELMRTFFDKYKNTHIYPEDLIEHFSSNSSKDITWFFDDFLLSNKKPDYKISGLRQDSLIIKNVGKCSSPLFLQIGDSIIISDGFTGKKRFYIGQSTDFAIDPEFKTLDLNRSNNYYRKGFLKPNRPVKLSIANFMDNPQIFQIPVLPMLTYNTADGFSPGLLIYTSPFPKKKFEFQIMPLWGIKTGLLNGFANISYFIHPKEKIIKEIEIFTSSRRFGLGDDMKGFYFKFSQGLCIRLRTNPNKNVTSELIMRNVTANSFYFSKKVNLHQVKYEFNNYRLINPWSISADFHAGNGFSKISAELIKTFNYNEDIGLRIRLFAGKFLYSSDVYYGNYNYRMFGNTGDQDYFYDELFVGRTENIRQNPENLWAHQYIRNDGGYTMFSPLGQTDNWLLALNIDSETPLRVIDIYLNIGAYPQELSDPVVVLFETGIKFKIFKDFFSMYFPIYGSKNVWDISNAIYTENYLQKVRFTLSLDKLNLLNYRNKPFLLF
ncbi:MAG: M1 family metallopeptidase [Bacteroidales bacterium]|nr:M1 family metallopeptidase [Bacteroidales bacterium]